MLKHNSKIGIWGFGLVGQSLVHFFNKHGYQDLVVYDIKPLDPVFAAHEFNFTTDLASFLQECDYIFPSPGVDLQPYQDYHAKFKNELDLFYKHARQSIWAITGTLGKTTLTSMLASLVNQAGIKAIAAGNIGLPMLDVLGQDLALVVLELSSFQLESCTQFAPDLAIWTNFYANHLDRHKTLEKYFLAKAQIFLNQTAQQVALLPISLIPDLINFNLKIKSQCYFFGLGADLNPANQAYLSSYARGVFLLEGQQVSLQTNFKKIKIGSLATFEQINTYEMNLVILLAVMYLKKITLPEKLVFEPIDHRLERFCDRQNITWYNDSKSTVPQATLAAVSKLAGRPIILFLGGVSKGVDRTGLIQALKNQVKLVICFGGEAQDLYQACLQYQLNSASFTTLEKALDYCLQVATAGDQVLFSPGGASFDLFKNYVERGNSFKQLVCKQVI